MGNIWNSRVQHLVEKLDSIDPKKGGKTIHMEGMFSELQASRAFLTESEKTGLVLAIVRACERFSENGRGGTPTTPHVEKILKALKDTPSIRQ